MAPEVSCAVCTCPRTAGARSCLPAAASQCLAEWLFPRCLRTYAGMLAPVQRGEPQGFGGLGTVDD